MPFFSAINDDGKDAHAGQYPRIERHQATPDIQSTII
jgi:hypothetical protein